MTNGNDLAGRNGEIQKRTPLSDTTHGISTNECSLINMRLGFHLQVNI